jgi:iron complex transport system permease protein
MIRPRGTVPAAAPAPVVREFAARPTRIAPVSARTRTLRLFALALLLPAVMLLALCVGSVPVPVAQVWQAIIHPNIAPAHVIVVDLRLPRVLIAAGVGAGLGVAGALLQALFRNPLVDPFVTGVSAGAALAAAIGLTLGLSFGFTPALAFVGGLACAAIVTTIGAGDSPSGNLRLVLAGVAVSALASSIVTLILLQRAGGSNLSILAWLAGGLNGRGWSDLGPMAAYLGVGGALAMAQVHAVNVLRLGPSAASGFGLALDATRWRLLAIASLITAACVAVSGVVGFVGLMVPHGVRRLLSGDARWLLPGSAIAGAAVVVVADLLARTVMAPAEVPLGVLLAFVGVPFFLLLARRPVEL